MSHSSGDGRDAPRKWALVRSAGCSIGLWLVVLACVGCATTRQSAGELNAGLVWFVPPVQAGGWPSATDTRTRLERAPLVVIAWSPASSPEGEASSPATRAVRERWIAAIKEKIDRSGHVAGVEGSPPGTFDGGVSLTGVQKLAADQHADMIVLFSLDFSERRYHVSWPGGFAVYVVDVIEVLATARAVGLAPTGRPVFAETQTGFDENTTEFESEVEETAGRVAVNALADAIVRRIHEVSSGRGSP